LVSLPSSLRRFALATLSIGLWFIVAGQPAHAAFPGANGKIAFDRDTETISKVAMPRGGSSDETDQIWTMNPDGSAATNITNVTDGSRFDAEAAWSADGTKIVFGGQNDRGSQIWTMNADGSGQVNVTNDPSSNDFDPAWSPDGTKIVYTHRDPDNQNLGEIWVMNADGSGKHRLFPSFDSDSDGAVWSPDGTKVAFQARDNGNQQIFVGNADGSGTPQNVSNDDVNDVEPDWSPDGTKLAFAKGSPEQIWVMNADGSSPHAVTQAQADIYSNTLPAFSPDGTLITYMSLSGEGTPVPFRGTIWMVGADGSNPHQVSTPDLNSGDDFPDWQPVGSPSSSAAFAACTGTGAVTVHAGDATGFKSALNVHFKVDGGAEQVAAADGAGNATIALGNGAHTVEYWGGDAAGYQEAAHHSGTTTVDTTNHCSPPAVAPKVSVAGVRRACVSKAFHVRVHISSQAGAKSVRVFLGKKRVLSTTKTSFSLRINPKKLAHRTRLRIVATDSNGKVTTITRTIARCAVAKPRRHAAPRFTG
jgi:TolB protein